MKKAVFECALRAKDAGDAVTVELLSAMARWDGRCGEPDFDPLVEEDDYTTLRAEAIHARDASIRNLAGEDGLRRFRDDPDAFCCQVLNEFYANHLNNLMDDRDQEELVAAIIRAFACGEYEKPEWKQAGFSPEWFSVLKPLLSSSTYKVLMRHISATH